MGTIQQFDGLIFGAGAAGLMCAAESSKRGRKVAVIEKADRVGKKILISGGGRCNFTNIHCTAENFISSNPHFAKSALARYTPADFVALVEKHQIPYHEKKLGQLFCDRSATDITNMLERECAPGGVKIFVNTDIREVGFDTEFWVRGEAAEFRAPVLVIATGGLSIPKIGATGFGYEIASKFGLKIRQTFPGLVPLIFADEDQNHCRDLAGISANVQTSFAGHSFRDGMLITHRGLSGPAILQISSYWKQGEPIHIDLAPDVEITRQLRQSSARSDSDIHSLLHKILSVRFAERWLESNRPEAKRNSQWTNQALEELERNIHHWALIPAGTEGYKKAEVTVGGVDPDELSPRTMESRKVRGLFFIGEVVDVTGHLGGHNFQWAWSSAVAAGQAI